MSICETWREEEGGRNKEEYINTYTESPTVESTATCGGLYAYLQCMVNMHASVLVVSTLVTAERESEHQTM